MGNNHPANLLFLVMTSFEGVGCCLEAMEKECWLQLQRDKCICGNCYLGYQYMYRLVMKDSDKYYSGWLKERKKLHRVFEKYWKGLGEWKNGNRDK